MTEELDLSLLPEEQLLLAAAAAAGLAVVRNSTVPAYRQGNGLLLGFDGDGLAIRWNPRLNDADAFWLLVTLRLNLYRDDCTCCVDVGYSYDETLESQKLGTDALAATRLAVTYAAAGMHLRAATAATAVAQTHRVSAHD